MHSGAFRHLPDLVSNGSVSHERLDEAVLNVLRAKAAMGLFSNPYKTLDPSKEWPKGQGDKIEAHEQLARRAARKSLVLLKNENEILPLKKRGQRIAVIGWWANSTDTDGVGVIWGNKSHTVTLLQGFLDGQRPGLLQTDPGFRVKAIRVWYVVMSCNQSTQN